jgi:hypothetical protein
MKTYTSILLLSCLWLVNCTTKERNEQAATTTTATVEQKQTNFDLEGKIVWKKNGKSIKQIIEGNNDNKVLISGFKYNDSYQQIGRLLGKNDSTMLFDGKISEFGDLNNDDVPEFIMSYWSYATLINVANNKIANLKSFSIKKVKNNCAPSDAVNLTYTLDTLFLNDPLLFVKERLDSQEEDCANHIVAYIPTYYKLIENELVEIRNCPINDTTISLERLYQFPTYFQYDFMVRLGGGIDYFQSYFWFEENLKACGKVPNNGIGEHFEKLAGLKITGGSANKRSDLMPNIKEAFKNINPAFIRWARENLIPKPNQEQANGLSYQFIYNNNFKNYIRNLAVERLLILQNNQEALLQEYIKAVNNKIILDQDRYENDAVISLIYKREEWLNELIMERYNDIKPEEYMIYGFWMRRILDGSETEIWKTVKHILNTYDRKWFQNEQSKVNTPIKLDATDFYKAYEKADTSEIILSTEFIPQGIAIQNAKGVTINLTNGKVISFDNNDTGNWEVLVNYSLTGYWPKREMIMIEENGKGSISSILININNGITEYVDWHFYPSPNGRNAVGIFEDIEYEQVSLYKRNENQWLSNISLPSYIDSYFWLDNIFYYSVDNQYFSIGIGFDDVQPYTPPKAPIKTDSLPTDSTVVE